jgi:hypothetical protein
MATSIWAQVFTPVGPFTGYASGQIPDEPVVIDAEIEKLQKILRENCGQFVIYGKDDEEITFQSDTIKNSVFVFSASRS